MKNTIEQLLSNCSEIDFGTIALSNDQQMFYDHFNRSILLLCESLPDSAQTDALFFFMEYSGLSIGQKLDFFKNYYVPSWSMIYWLGQCLPENQGSEKQDLQNAITAQAMAMILHSLDDHINDQQIPASHLTLLLRSYSWTTMMQALENLIKDLKDGRKIVDYFINNYYSGILESDNNKTLEGYCESFKNQMATWLIVPVLMAKKMTTDKEFAHAIQTAYESFGIAWRLLDDINDVETDLKKGSQSAVYLCLPDDIKKKWGKDSGEESLHNIDFSEVVYDSILKNNIVYRLQQKICKALESAASLSDRCNMAGLANEYRCLLKPLKDARVLK